MDSEGRSLVVQSVDRNTLSKQVVDRIIELLLSGQLKPGDKLPTEMELMEQLDVSRPVIREALSSLETLEVIRRRSRGGTYFNYKVGTQPFRAILALAVNNLPAIMEARMTLELGLVTIAAEKITDEQLRRLKETIDEIANSVNDNYGWIDKEFHQLIATSVSNPVLDGLIESLLLAHERTDKLIRYRERELTVQYHTAIYEALAKHDPYESFTAMYRHLSYVRDKILSSKDK